MPINRNLLHKNQVAQFKQWLVDNGYTLAPTIGPYEVVRIKRRRPDSNGHGGHPAVVFYMRDRTDHLTITDQTQLNLARRFIAARRSSPTTTQQRGTNEQTNITDENKT